MNKIPCGGFYVGDGLELDGKELKLSGGGSSGDNVFIIDEDAEDFNPQSPEYGNKVKDALLAGKNVYYKMPGASLMVYSNVTRDNKALGTMFVYSSIDAFGIYQSPYDNKYYLYMHPTLKILKGTTGGDMAISNDSMDGIVIHEYKIDGQTVHSPAMLTVVVTL